MTKILHIAASPKGAHSSSRRIADIFLTTLQETTPDVVLDTLVLFEESLPDFGQQEAEAKFAPIFGQERTADQEQAWQNILDCVARFDAADKIVVSSPMWNFSIPYKLKHYLDLIMQPRVTFGYDPQTMQHLGLLKNRPLQLILTRSSIMPGHHNDFQLSYLRFAFEFMGIRDIRALTAWQTTKPTAENREAYIRSFFDQAEAAARTF